MLHNERFQPTLVPRALNRGVIRHREGRSSLTTIDPKRLSPDRGPHHDERNTPLWRRELRS